MGGDMLDAAWGLIANASGGDWAKERAEWQLAASRWRDQYLRAATNDMILVPRAAWEAAHRASQEPAT